jgi:hypothetical protein
MSFRFKGLNPWLSSTIFPVHYSWIILLVATQSELLQVLLSRSMTKNTCCPPPLRIYLNALLYSSKYYICLVWYATFKTKIKRLKFKFINWSQQEFAVKGFKLLCMPNLLQKHWPASNLSTICLCFAVLFKDSIWCIVDRWWFRRCLHASSTLGLYCWASVRVLK